MILIQRKARPGGHPTFCSNPGCQHSAKFDAVFLGTEHTLLCTKCAGEWRAAYDNALRGWPDEPAHLLAKNYREAAA